MSEYIKKEDAIDAVNTYKGQRFGEDRDMYIKRVISELSAADVAEVRHGRWEKKDDPYGFFDIIPVCSECGRTTELRKQYAYCPYCGAKMDERKQEHD